MTAAGDLSAHVRGIFQPGAMYTFVGAGGKSTAMRAVAAILSAHGTRVRMTTTTRVGIAEFDGYPVAIARSVQDMMALCLDDEPVRLIVAGVLPAEAKYGGLALGLLSGLSLGEDLVLLVEGDGSRQRPLKVPTVREPVIPASTATVIAVLGASGFEGPIDERLCYNHRAALALLGKAAGTFEASAIAALVAHPAGYRRGVLPGMGFHVLVNQGDLVEKRPTAIEVLRILKETYGIRGSLVSLRQEVMYETTEL
ncbi:MAG TPA: selenium cofactor biosynthesis protein YqeC [Spirochaetia bacterium]|nr:selenium cofactor biosynthesis protein YqeC [Spirochaetia bacterium]